MDEQALGIPDVLCEAAAVGALMEQLLAEHRMMPAADVKLRAKQLRGRAAKVLGKIERALAWADAVSMAHKERTGKPLRPGEAFPLVDGQRALEILKFYPTN